MNPRERRTPAPVVSMETRAARDARRRGVDTERLWVREANRRRRALAAKMRHRRPS